MARIYWTCRQLDNIGGHEAGRALLKELYGIHVGGQLPPIAVTELGKPYLEGSDWHFSISHTRHYAFCVLCDCPVGLDAEELNRQVSPLLADKALSPGERAQYDAASDKNRALLTFWVLKEADSKRTGRGIGFHPNHTDFMLTDQRVFIHSDCLVAIVY